MLPSQITNCWAIGPIEAELGADGGHVLRGGVVAGDDGGGIARGQPQEEEDEDVATTAMTGMVARSRRAT